MARRLAAFVLLPLLAACAPLQPAPQLVWHKQGAGSGEFEQTRYQCLQRSTQAAPVHEVVTGVGQTIVDKGVVYHEDANAQARNNLFDGCMRAAGWRLLRQADLAQLQAQQQQQQRAPQPAVQPVAVAAPAQGDVTCSSLAPGIVYRANSCWNQDHPASAAELDQFRKRFKGWAQQPVMAGVARKVPAPGTRVYNSLGGYAEYLGSDGPLVFYRNSRGEITTTIGALYGLNANQTRLPVETIAAMWPFTIGSSRSFELGTRNASYDMTLRVVRRETVTVPAGKFDAVVIERHQKGRAPNYHDSIVTSWLALREGVLVKEDLDLIAGTTTLKPWQAVSIGAAPAPDVARPASPGPALQPVAATAPVGGNGRAVPLVREGGVFVLPVLINNAITLKFVLDSGASDVSVPADVFMTLIRAGTIAKEDLLGKQTYQTADGTAVPSERFRIRSLKVGDVEITNVVGSVASVKGPLLLGQSFLGRLRNWSIDNAQHAFVMN